MVQLVKLFLDASQRMAVKLNLLLDHAETIALEGLKKCNSHIQKQIYLFSFRHPNITAVQVAKQFKISPSTARSALNALDEIGLLFKDKSQKRNVEYLN